MPNITLYVKDSDLEVVTAAKKSFGESLSATFIDCIRQRMAKEGPGTEADASKMERLKLWFWNSKDEPVIQKSFVGRWLVGDEEDGLRADDNSLAWDAGAEWSVAQTAKGNLVVYLTHRNDGFAPSMETYESFEDMRLANDDNVPRYPQNILAEAAEALGRPYEIEMDI